MTDKLKSIIITITFFGILIGFAVANIIKDDESISIAERRKLTTFPEISIAKIFDGTFFNKFDTYATDQFVEREKFRTLKISTEFDLFKRNDYNNLYEHDGYLIENLYPLNENSVNNIISKIQQIEQTYATSQNNIYFTIIPDKNYFINKGNLKLDYSKLEKMMQYNLSATYIPLMENLGLEDYYKTDSHWKQENLEKIANILLYQMGQNTTSTYTKKEVITFKGTYSGRIPQNKENDKIIILTNDIINNSSVFYYDTNKSGSIYNYEKFNSLDKYDIYLSGATPLIKIENKNATTSKELIIFRDSYGSSIIPLLITAYKKITVVDTRYISPKLLSNYINFNSQDILFMYSTLLINNSFSLK